MKNKTITIIATSCLVLMTLLLCTGKLDSHDYALSFGIISVMTITLLTVDRLKELDLKNLRLVLSEVKQVKADIYAKAETLRSLAENIADIATALITDRIPQRLEIQFINERYDRERERVLTRNKVLAILQGAGSHQDKIERTKEAFNQVIQQKLQYLLRSVLSRCLIQHLHARHENIGREMTERHKAIDPANKEAHQALEHEARRRYEAHQELQKNLSSEQIQKVAEAAHYDADEIERYYQTKQIWDEQLHEHLERFKAFTKEINIDMKHP